MRRGIYTLPLPAYTGAHVHKKNKTEISMQYHIIVCNSSPFCNYCFQ